MLFVLRCRPDRPRTEARRARTVAVDLVRTEAAALGGLSPFLYLRCILEEKGRLHVNSGHLCSTASSPSKREGIVVGDRPLDLLVLGIPELLLSQEPLRIGMAPAE